MTGRQSWADRGGSSTGIAARRPEGGRPLTRDALPDSLARSTDAAVADVRELLGADGRDRPGHARRRGPHGCHRLHALAAPRETGLRGGGRRAGMFGTGRVERAHGTATGIGGSTTTDAGPGDVLVDETFDDVLVDEPPGGGDHGPPPHDPPSSRSRDR
ncbi:hypothetical protein ACFRDV_19500 [Streptomyces fagopyri]|uniref:hypothetical protein n=1 Tax=Streptomyces fagopyri TaxID=2662397 RepID=UPI0036A6FFB6